MKTIKFLIIPLILLLVFGACQFEKPEETTRGHLMIVGGRGKPPLALDRFVKLCDGGTILIIPSASAVPHESGPEAVQLFRDHGATDVEYLFISSVDSANNEHVVEKVRQAKGIFFTGGSQTRLMKRIGFSKTEEVIRDLYFNQRGIIGGTSAGAAVMSEIMITGDGDFTLLHKDNIATIRGFGLLTNCIIDQHFVKRRRNNRLISVAIESGLPGIGIDESTCIFYNPDDTFEVFGESNVIVYDPRNASELMVTGDSLLSMSDMKMTILKSGHLFNMLTGHIHLQ